MHELAITSNLVELVSNAAGNRRVKRVTLEVGALSGVMTEAIAFCFDMVVEGTMLEGATLDIRMIEGRARCLECGAEFTTPTLYAACECGALRFQRLQGEELKIKSMELEEAA
ncbi:hydrogenase maturation nickel metallochaperone HypA [Beijerinckiaceae bacterium]|nr:hydrogenase maturation nickel metallochaperone HypA [Beijerinckiaceae bacterium]